MSTVKISIIIPIYNHAEVIEKCLKSIFEQTFKDFEVIVVNDGSTDNLLLVMRPWLTKIKFFNRQNSGAPSARNFGFEQSIGEYLLFCDADVIMKPDMLEKMYDKLQADRSATYVYSSFKFGWKTFKLWPFNEKKLKNIPYIHTTSLLRRECFPGFDEGLKRFQDWDLWLTLWERGRRGVWLNEILFQVAAAGTMSKWLPKMIIGLPLKLKEITRYKTAKKIIQDKHHIK
ncbi:glycosyltransferase family 2 protein [Candidatus Falkowbacteria bacterium]|nr:glycosyltransferase family 2 protein [Candidatus Falkowbacteria bacterium]